MTTEQDAAAGGPVERLARCVQAELDAPLRVLADACLNDADRLGPELAGALGTVVDYIRNLDDRLADIGAEPGRGPGPRLTMALASELSFIARHLDAPLPGQTVQRLQPRVRRAARLATLWLTPYAERGPTTTTAGPGVDSVAAWSEQRALEDEAFEDDRHVAPEAGSVTGEPVAPIEPTEPRAEAPSGAAAERGPAPAGDTAGESDAGIEPTEDAAAAVLLVRQRIEELRERAELLESGARLQDRYWRFATHELRNAAHALVLAVERVATTEAGAAPWLQPMMRAAEAVVARSEEALDDRRVSRGVLDVHPRSIDLVEAALSALEHARPMAVRSDVRLVAERLPVGQPVWATADPVRVQQILTNLLRNAIRATPPGGFVIAEAGHTNGETSIVVSDSGSGVEPDAAATLFSIDQEERPSVGFGIGLPLSRHLARLMGGELELLPHRPGLGGRFRLRLPRGSE